MHKSINFCYHISLLNGDVFLKANKDEGRYTCAGVLVTLVYMKDYRFSVLKYIIFMCGFI